MGFKSFASGAVAGGLVVTGFVALNTGRTPEIPSDDQVGIESFTESAMPD